MGYEVSNNIDNAVVSEEEFTKLKAEKLNPEAEYSPKRYRIVAIEWTLLDAIKTRLEEIAEEAEDEDWDGTALRQYNEDEAVSDLLKKLFTVEKTPNRYRVTVEFTVESDNETDAEEEVTQAIRGYIDYEILSTDED